jgi:hypothetical protein
VIDAPPAHEWPFRYPLCPELPAGPLTVRARCVDDAYANAQAEGARLVTTQRAYLDAEWSAALAHHGDATLEIEDSPHGPITHPLALA